MRLISILVVCLLISSTLLIACVDKENEQEAIPESKEVEIVEENDIEDEVPVENDEETVVAAPEESVAVPEEKPEEKLEEIPEEKPIAEYIAVESFSLSFNSVTLSVGDKRMPIVRVTPSNATNKGESWISSDESVAKVDRLGNITAIAEGTCTVTVTSTDNNDVYSTVNVTVVPQPDLTYIDGILVVNKTYPLPNTYAPGWETEATAPLWEMISAAKAEGIHLWMTSGYRSYYDQEYIYNGYVARDGQAEADTYSARPGHSEHQTGLAYDLNDLASNFGETPEGKWVAENCHKYGFIVRYPKEKEAITGYIYEPWHIRYLGVEKATEVYESGLCLEEFLGITSVYAE